MNTKSNTLVKRLAVTLLALVAIAGICAFAPKSASNSKLRLDNVHTDGASVYAPANDKLARGSWFVEMVLPTGS